MPHARAARLIAMVKRRWNVFNPDGVKYSVIGYECDVDTGNAAPVSCGNIKYGPRESKEMEKHIGALCHMAHIYEVEHSAWISKALLAPKPHQETIYDIMFFKWRFCVNYICLNQVTLVMVSPIPRCDNASMCKFGDGGHYWLLDCPMGYHQVRVNKRSRPKLAFAGPGAKMYTYNVMPFGPVNGPEIFIRMMFDINTEWPDLAMNNNVTINEDTNFKLIVDDVFSHAITEDSAFKHMESQLIIPGLL